MRVISLFCGCGGMDVGLAKSGHKIVWANDNDKDSILTYTDYFTRVFKSNKEHIVVKLENLLEIGIIGAENHCDFTAGCLSGVLEGLLQQPYSVAEEMVGEETRLFKFDKK